MYFCRELLESSDYSGSRPQQQIIIDVIDVIRATGWSLTQTIREPLLTGLQKNELRLSRNDCLDAVLRIVARILSRDRMSTGAIYQISHKAPSPDCYQRLGAEDYEHSRPRQSGNSRLNARKTGSQLLCKLMRLNRRID
jgi:hypothetical protein